jgi:hypothetical protein
MADIVVCKSDEVYVIIEQIYTKGGIPTLGNTVGASLTQIHRVVAQVCLEQQIQYDGKPINGAGIPSLWQVATDYFSPGRLTQKPTGKRSFVLAYGGFINSVQPLNQIGNLTPEVLTKTYDFVPPTPYLYGKDPLPTVRLYKDPKVKFVSLNGGQNPPTAVAIYNKTSGQISYPSIDFAQQAIEDVLKKHPGK